MTAPTPRQIHEPYGLSPSFERAVSWLACSRPRFWGTVAHSIEPDLLDQAACKLALKAAGAIAKELGRGPESTVLVLQRIRRWVTEGKCTLEQCQDVGAMFDDAEDEGATLMEESTTNELVPILRRRIQREAIRLGIKVSQEDKPLAPVLDLFSRAHRLGVQDVSLGTKFGLGSMAELTGPPEDRLPTGISDLDGCLDGGMERGQMGVVGGYAGGGKSMFLAQVAAETIWSGRSVAYATLELPVKVQNDRIAANLFGIPVNDIRGTAKTEVERRFTSLDGLLGPLYLRHFTAQATTVDDIREWVTGTEAFMTSPIDLVIVDYADKMTARSTKKKEDKGEYSGMRDVFEGLRIFAEETRKWMWTATQLKRKDDKRKKRRADGDDVADSIHKTRVTDILITLNPDEDQTEIAYFVSKNRTGRSQIGAGPLPVDWTHGRIALMPSNRPEHVRQKEVPF